MFYQYEKLIAEFNESQTSPDDESSINYNNIIKLYAAGAVMLSFVLIDFFINKRVYAEINYANNVKKNHIISLIIKN